MRIRQFSPVGEEYRRTSWNDALGHVILRAATLDDAPLLLDWRNDRVTRTYSRRSELVTADEHAAWLASVLADPSRRLYVAEIEGEPVGTARLDLDGDEAEISLTVAPRFRGRRIAPLIIALATQDAWRHALVRVRAEIKPENEASLRAFAGAGYVAGEPRDGLVVMWATPPALG